MWEWNDSYDLVFLGSEAFSWLQTLWWSWRLPILLTRILGRFLGLQQFVHRLSAYTTSTEVNDHPSLQGFYRESLAPAAGKESIRSRLHVSSRLHFFGNKFLKSNCESRKNDFSISNLNLLISLQKRTMKNTMEALVRTSVLIMTFLLEPIVRKMISHCWK